MNSPYDTNKVFTVSEISFIIKGIIDEAFPTVKVEGEVTGFRGPNRGHLYFRIKDKDDSVLQCVMFSMNAKRLDFDLRDGDKVVVTGKLTAYAKGGYYQLVATKMVKAGLGDILLKIIERKAKLEKEGLFDASHKKPLPRYPFVIGVVTSESAAALRDIKRIIKERNPCILVKVFPSLVQGKDAAANIVEQIRIANETMVNFMGVEQLCDVLIVGRGGGSVEDLLPFSDEAVVRAIYDSRIPIVSAVGHEIDWALSDYAADRRASTPSNAAELCAPLLSDIKTAIENAKAVFIDTVQTKIDTLKKQLSAYNIEDFYTNFSLIEQPILAKLHEAIQIITSEAMNRYIVVRAQFDTLNNTLKLTSPKELFKRGYAFVRRRSDDQVVSSTFDVGVGEDLAIQVSDGKFFATVDEKESGYL